MHYEKKAAAVYYTVNKTKNADTRTGNNASDALLIKQLTVIQ